MAPLRSPSTSDDPLDDDPQVDPLDLTRARVVDHRWPASFDRWVDRSRRLPASPARLASILGAVLVLVAGAWWLLRPPSPPLETSLPMASGAGPTSGGGAATATIATGGAVTSTTAGDLVVQAAGAINRPGVYHLVSTARVDDLVRAAGGLRPDADGDRVNLAAPLVDGSRVWVPAHGEAEPPDVVPASGGSSAGTPVGGAGSSTVSSPEPVDLNAATAEQLDTLPGVGPSTASAILAYRNEHGPFSSVDDLLEVRGIGEAKLEQIRPLARV